MTAFPADGFDGFRAWFGRQNDRATLVAKCLPHLASQVFLVGIGEQLIPVDEQEEGGWRLSDLGGVEEFQPVPHGADRLPALDRILKGPVQDCRGNLLLQLGRHVARLQATGPD